MAVSPRSASGLWWVVQCSRVQSGLRVIKVDRRQIGGFDAVPLISLHSDRAAPIFIPLESIEQLQISAS